MFLPVFYVCNVDIKIKGRRSRITYQALILNIRITVFVLSLASLFTLHEVFTLFYLSIIRVENTSVRHLHKQQQKQTGTKKWRNIIMTFLIITTCVYQYPPCRAILYA